MLANRKFVRNIVEQLADLTANMYYRRQWCDKTNVSDEQRLLTFRFWDAAQADNVAKQLQAALVANGYTNKVKRTSVKSNYATYTEGGEYVRVRVMFD